MLRGIVGFFLGMFLGALTLACCLNDYMISAIAIDIVAFIIFVFWCNKHHNKMRNKYYDRFKKGIINE